MALILPHLQLIDVTEQVIERPSQKQKNYFSGKKKRLTLKTEFKITSEGRITRISKSYKGKAHDFKISKEAEPIPIGTRFYADWGYQGIKNRTQNARIPIKKSQKKSLGYGQKLDNKVVAKRRIKGENVIAEVKNFRILAHRYRNKRKAYNLKFNLIAGIVHFKNGFWNAQLAT